MTIDQRIRNRKSRARMEGTLVRRLVCAALAIALGSIARAQSPAPYGQQIAVIKTIKPGIITIGVVASRLDEHSLEQIVRAATGQGIKIVVAKPQELTQVASLYNELVGDKKVDLLWIPDAGDKMLLGQGFEFLREKALHDKIGILVPDQALVSAGALCSVVTESGKLTAYVSQRIAPLIGASVPSDPGGSIRYVSR